MSHLVPVRDYSGSPDPIAAIHAARLERQRRIAAAAYVPPAPAPKQVEPVVQLPRRDWIDLAPSMVFARCTSARVLAVVGAATGISPDELRSERRFASIVAARQVACWLMRKHTVLSLPQIGRALGGRDHSTILHAINRADHLRESDPVYCDLVDDLAAKLKFGGTE